jgi:hypothetical protein
MSNNGNNSGTPCNNSCNDSNCINSLAECFFSLPPKQFALLSSLLGILLVDNLDLDQQNSLGNFIVNVGQAILVAAAQGQSVQSNNSQNDRIRQQLLTLKQQLYALEEELDNSK